MRLAQVNVARLRWDLDSPQLHAFVYRSRHGGLVRRRAEWFVPTPPPYAALWWVADGVEPRRTTRCGGSPICVGTARRRRRSRCAADSRRSR